MSIDIGGTVTKVKGAIKDLKAISYISKKFDNIALKQRIIDLQDTFLRN